MPQKIEAFPTRHGEFVLSVQLPTSNLTIVMTVAEVRDAYANLGAALQAEEVANA
jgi:hypothetical protein